MFDILLFVFSIIITFLFLDALEIVIFGCWRKFKNGRKCKVWHCPNRKECTFFNK